MSNIPDSPSATEDEKPKPTDGVAHDVSEGDSEPEGDEVGEDEDDEDDE